MYKEGQLIDPSSGWRYGFPKRLERDLNSRHELIEWLLENGYPREELYDKDGNLDYLYIRVIG